MKYRSDIDGLRAIAVISVLLYHYQLGPITGGFVGVDVFFVISGFLITTILKNELSTNQFSITGFYVRRIRRILPALLFVIATSLFAGYLILMPGDYMSFAQQAAYASVGLSNFYFMNNTGYFDQNADILPLLHTWSLAVEEQFYVFWPLGLLLCWKLPFNKLITTRVFIITTIGISLYVCITLVINKPTFSFYMLPSRAWEMAIGGLIAFLPVLISRAVSEVTSLTGLGLILYSLFTLDSSAVFPGINAVPPVVGAALILWPKNYNTIISRILSMRPLVFTGLISYSLYLWHWPILVFYRHYNHQDFPDTQIAIALLILSFGFATLSWRYVERPFRKGQLPEIKTIITGVISMCVVAASSMMVLIYSGFPSRLSAQAQPLASIKDMWEWECKSTVKLDGRNFCGFGADWNTSKTRVFLWGDSHAQAIAPIIEEIIKDKNTSVILHHACPAMLGGEYKLDIPDHKRYNNNKMCNNDQRRTIKTLQAHPEINVVTLVSAWSFNVWKMKVDNEHPLHNKGRLNIFDASLRELIQSIKTSERSFILAQDFPIFNQSPISCYIQDEGLIRKRCSISSTYVTAKRYAESQGGFNKIFSKIADDDKSVKILKTGDVLCASEICLNNINGEFLYRDGDHIRRNLSPETRKILASKIGLTDLF